MPVDIRIPYDSIPPPIKLKPAPTDGSQMVQGLPGGTGAGAGPDWST